MEAQAKEIEVEEPETTAPEVAEGVVTIDMANPENAAALAGANVGDCVYLRITAKSGTEISGNVEEIEPMDEDGAENEDRAYRDKSGKDTDMPHGITLVIAKRR